MTRKKLTKEEKELALLHSNVRTVLQSSQGKELIWHILSLCGVYDNPIAGDALQTGHNIGRQTIGKELIELMVDADARAYINLQLHFVNKTR